MTWSVHSGADALFQNVSSVNIVRQSLDSALRCQRHLVSLNVPVMVIPLFCLTPSKSLRTRGTDRSTSSSAQRTRSTPNRNSGHHLLPQKVWHLLPMSELKRSISEHSQHQKMVFRVLSTISHLQSNSKIQSSFQDVYDTCKLDSQHIVLISRHPFQTLITSPQSKRSHIPL